MIAMRRGVPSARTLPNSRRPSRSLLSTAAGRSASAFVSILAGISSQPSSNNKSAGMGQLLCERNNDARCSERTCIDAGIADAIERFLRLRANRRRQEREAKLCAVLHVRMRAVLRHAANATDEALALGDADRAACVERVELVRALHAELVRRQHEARREQAIALAFVGVEVAERDLRVELLEVIR